MHLDIMDYGAITYYQAQLKGAVRVITEAHVCHVSAPLPLQH